MQTPRDFEMDHQPQVVGDAKCDLLAQPPHVANDGTVRRAQRRISRAQQKRRPDEHAKQPVADNARAKRIDV
jgi:hypothetical protein